MSSPICFSPDLSAAVDSAQGQSMVPVLWGVEVDGQPPNAPESPCCAVKILMRQGKVSNPHVHDEVHVYVTLDPGSPPVCTLSGDRLQVITWTRGGETLWIPPGVPHVAICPITAPDNPDWLAVGTEFRTTPSYRHDVRPLPEMWNQVRIDIELRNLKVDADALPEPAVPTGGCWPSEIPYRTS